MEKGIEIAQRLGIDKFKASNGWLTRWKGRYNVKHRVESGESGDVRTDSGILARAPSINNSVDSVSTLDVMYVL